MNEITVFLATDAEYWGDGWDILADNEQDEQIERMRRLIEREAPAFGYDAVIVETVPETFSRPHRNDGDAAEIVARAWDAWCRGEDTNN